MMNNKDFAVFILTHGRTNKVYTIEALKKHGYTGKIYLIIDNEDKTSEEYYKKFENVIMFDKKAIAEETDTIDNFNDLRGVVYARNACFNIAKDLNITYFMVLDDDYTSFDYRLYIDKAIFKNIKNLDKIFDVTLDYYKTINVKSIAFAQTGDFIGGIDNGNKLFRFSLRKIMNSFLCSTERPFKFMGRINEDVNVYTSYQSQGNMFLTIHNLSLTQRETQKTKGGLTEIYLDFGTFIKSFYTVICSPSSVKVKLMNTTHRRLHHSINWDCAVPQIIDEKYKK